MADDVKRAELPLREQIARIIADDACEHGEECDATEWHGEAADQILALVKAMEQPQDTAQTVDEFLDSLETHYKGLNEDGDTDTPYHEGYNDGLDDMARSIRKVWPRTTQQPKDAMPDFKCWNCATVVTGDEKEFACCSECVVRLQEALNKQAFSEEELLAASRADFDYVCETRDQNEADRAEGMRRALRCLGVLNCNSEPDACTYRRTDCAADGSFNCQTHSE